MIKYVYSPNIILFLKSYITILTKNIEINYLLSTLMNYDSELFDIYIVIINFRFLCSIAGEVFQYWPKYSIMA